MKATKFYRYIIAVLAVFAISLTTLAQETIEEGIEEIVVEGIRGSMLSAINNKRASDQIMESLTAEELGQMPDQNLADALSRVSGVSISRGEGGIARGVTIRGLNPDMTQIQMNGNTMATGNLGVANQPAGGRALDFNTIASEMVQSVEIFKSPTASMDAGGVAGTVNIKTRKPLDIGKRVMALQVQSRYQDLGEESSPSGSFVYNDVFGGFGFGAAITFEDVETRQDKFTSQWRDRPASHYDVDPGPDVEIPWFPIYFFEEEQRERVNLNSTLQFQINDQTTAHASVGYSKLEEEINDNLLRVSTNQSKGGNRFSNITVEDLAVVGATFRDPNVRVFDRFVAEETESKNLDAGIEWESGAWSVSVGAWLSQQDAEREQRDAFFEKRQTVTMTFGTSANLSNFSIDLTKPEDINALPFTRWRSLPYSVESEVTTFKIDATREMDSDWINSVQFGAKLKTYENTVQTFEADVRKCCKGNTVSENPVMADFIDGYTPEDFLSELGDFPAFPTLDGQAIADAIAASGADVTPYLNPLKSGSVEEESAAAYVQVNFSNNDGTPSVRGNFGVRVEQTETTSDGYTVDGTKAAYPFDPNPGARSVTEKYTDVLPSFNLIAEIREDLDLRFSGARVITRPSSDDIRIYASLQAGSDTYAKAQTRDPSGIDPYQADQFDLELNWYYAEGSRLSVAFFTKDIENFTTAVTQSGVDLGLDVRTDEFDVVNFGGGIPDGINDLFDVTTVVNGGEATLKGVEFSIEGMFPGAMNNFGYLINLTKVESDTEQYQNPITGEDLPLPFESRDTNNIKLFYEDDRFSAHIAYNYRDGHVTNVQNNQGFPAFAQDYKDISAALRYDVTENLTISVEGRNLTDESKIDYLLDPSMIQQYRNYGKTYLFGLRYSM